MIIEVVESENDNLLFHFFQWLQGCVSNYKFIIF